MKLIELRDDLINANKDGHDRATRSWYRYNGDKAAYRDVKSIARLEALAGQTYYNKGAELIDKISPRISEGIPREIFQADNPDAEDENQIAAARELNRWAEMYDEVSLEPSLSRIDDESMLREGIAIRKIGWHETQNRLLAMPIPAESFSPDGAGFQMNFADMQAICHTTWHNAMYVKRHYQFKQDGPGQEQKDFTFRRRSKDDEKHRIDEIWIRKELAEDMGIKANRMVRIILIDDRTIQVRHSPWWYPDFPFAAMRCFNRRDPESGKPVEFWGDGYIDKVWNIQLLMDDLIAELLWILRNQSVSQILAPKGMIDGARIDPVDRLVIEYDGQRYSIDQLTDLPPGVVPPVLPELLAYFEQKIEDLTGINNSFSGELEQGSLSGRAIAALQAAAFTQLANIVRSKLGFIARMGYIKGRIIQQMATRPLETNQWRYGVDIKHDFPEEFRHTGFRVQVEDTTQLPQTVAGKLQLLGLLGQMGVVLSPKTIADITGIAEGYGIPEDELGINPMALGVGGNGQPSEDILQGRAI